MARIISEGKIVSSSSYFESVPLNRYLPVPLIYLSRPVLILGYLIWSAFLLLQYSIRRGNSLALSRQQFMKKWLWVLLGFLFILVTSHSLQIMITFKNLNSSIFQTVNLLQIISALGVAGLLISPFFFPQILYGLPRFPVVSDPHGTSVSGAGHGLPGQKDRVPRFEKDYIEEMFQKTEQCMKDLQPYLQHDFNIAQLSVMVNIPAHHLAWHFREVKQQSFTDFRNRWRVEHAKKLILDGKSNDLTLEAIGFLSGFSSRNTFLNAFKKAEGISPNAFLSQVKNSKNI
jgi:AraC-like DNA-binding protein